MSDIYRINARNPSGEGPDLKFRVDGDVFDRYEKYEWKYSFSSRR